MARRTTTENVTEKQIRALRRESAEAGDFLQVAICDVAIDGPINLSDYTTLDDVPAAKLAWLRSMTRREAEAECVRVIADAEAQDDLVLVNFGEGDGSVQPARLVRKAAPKDFDAEFGNAERGPGEEKAIAAGQYLVVRKVVNHAEGREQVVHLTALVP